MIPATTYSGAIIALRQMLIEELQIPEWLIINGDSLYGPDVQKRLTQLIAKAPDSKDIFIVFEFKEISNEAFGGTANDSTIATIASYGLFLKIYGDGSHACAQHILGLFKAMPTVEKLCRAGLKVLNTSGISSVNEFINNARWHRCDIEIDILCRLEFEIENSTPDIDQIAQPIHIIKA